MEFIGVADIMRRRAQHNFNNDNLDTPAQMGHGKPNQDNQGHLNFSSLANKVRRGFDLQINEMEWLADRMLYYLQQPASQFATFCSISQIRYYKECCPITEQPVSNIFVLSGQLHVVSKSKHSDEGYPHRNLIPCTTTSSLATSQSNIFRSTSINETLKQNAYLKLQLTIDELSGFGPAFAKTNQQKKIDGWQAILASEAVLIFMKPIHPCGLSLSMMELSQDLLLAVLRFFPVFDSFNMKLLSSAAYFVHEKGQLNQVLYRENQKPKYVYFIISGEVKLIKRRTFGSFCIKTLTRGCYFGEEELLGSKFTSSANITSNSTKGSSSRKEPQTLRSVEAICSSADVEYLTVQVEKFIRIIEGVDAIAKFRSLALDKLEQRKKTIGGIDKLQVGLFEPKSKDTIPDEPKIIINVAADSVPLGAPTSKQSFGRNGRIKSQSAPKVMHGVVIKQFSKNSSLQSSSVDEKLQFSMLRANPDMYESTLKKFRKYNIKPQPKLLNNQGRGFQRMWDLLNLEKVLRDEGEIFNSEGKQFFESSQKRARHIQQTKSTRPRTSSIGYRTKLQYVAFLQQLNR